MEQTNSSCREKIQYKEHEDTFDKLYDKLKQFIEINNKLPSSNSQDPLEKQLFTWSLSNRLNKKKGKLSDDKIIKLEKLQFWYWEYDSFNKIYERLEQFIKINNKLPSDRLKTVQEKRLAEWCSEKRYDKKKGELSDDHIQKLEKLQYWYWTDENIKIVIKSFDESYEQVKKWIEINNKLPTETIKDKYEAKLRIWCMHQRHLKKNGKLSNDKIQKLEKLNGWYWEKEHSFDERYEQLKQFIEMNKRIPSQFTTDPLEKQLYIWRLNTRNKKKKEKFSDDKIQKLEKLNDIFDKIRKQSDLSRYNKPANEKKEKISDNEIQKLEKSNDIFDERYEQLNQFIEINKKLPSSISKDPLEKQLGAWCSHKRTVKKKGKLSDVNIQKLEKLNGWFWEKEDPFDETYEQLKQFIETNKKLPSLTSNDSYEKYLSTWCACKRHYKKTVKLSDDKIQKLEKLNGWFWEKEDQFDETYEQLKQFIETNKKFPYEKSKNQQEKQLCSWCSNKRTDKKKGKLSDDKIQKLEKLTGWYWEKEDPFEDHFDKLKQFIKTNKKFPSLTSNDKYEKHLSKWCSSQRQEKKKSKLSDDKIQKLEKLTGWYWEKEDSFDEIYEQLKQFIEINKKLPYKNSKNQQEKQLGSWCSNKHTDKKKGKLSDEKIQKLEKLTGWYWCKNDQEADQEADQEEHDDDQPKDKQDLIIEKYNEIIAKLKNKDGCKKITNDITKRIQDLEEYEMDETKEYLFLASFIKSLNILIKKTKDTELIECRDKLNEVMEGLSVEI